MSESQQMIDLQREVHILREQVKDLTMIVTAVRVMTTRINPVCAAKLQNLLDSCAGCAEDEDKLIITAQGIVS